MSLKTEPNKDGKVLINNPWPPNAIPSLEHDATMAHKYRDALALLGKWAEESLSETPATQHPSLDAGSVLDLVNKTILG